MKKLLLIGSNTIHTYTFIELIEDYFDEIFLITDELRQGYSYQHECLDFRLNPLNLWKTPFRIKKIIHIFNPSVIHIHQANSYSFYSLLACRKFKIPTILTAWGSDILVIPKMNYFLKKMVIFSLKNANFFTSDSSFMAEEMRKLVPSIKNITLANFGISIEIQSSEKENIIFSNRLHKKLYNIDKIIEAFYIFSLKDKQNWRLVIAGNGEETDNLKKNVHLLNIDNKVSFVGWIQKEENANWYSKAKYWISIPESDATSISLLEAMASSCIPIVSNLPANKEWIEHKINGWICEKNAPNFLEKAIEYDFINAISINKKMIKEKGTKEANKRIFYALYDNILK